MSIADLVEKFRGIALERVEKMNQLLVELERAADPARTDDLLREVHTLKGEAKMMGFADVNLVSHLTEHVLLEAARVGFGDPKANLDVVFEGLDVLRGLLTKSAGAAAEPVDLTGFVDRVSDVRRGASPSPSPRPKRTSAPTSGPTSTGGNLRIQAAGTLRVDLARLERLGELTGEVLLLARRAEYQVGALEGLRAELRALSAEISPNLPKSQTARLRDFGHDIDAFVTTMRDDAYLEASRAGQLDDEARRLRHVPLAQVLSHYPRAVRDLAREQGKQVRLIHAFGGVEVDRVVLTGLSDPLLHLIRNAVDHGIEGPEEREAAGKDPEGELRLRAEYAGDAIHVVLSDDGRGIDPGLIRRKALERGVIDEATAERMDEGQLVNLIFEPGFSTRDEATDVSGRGIGMDVVRRQVSAIGGAVEIESEPGKGTTFTLSLPLSSAVSDVLLVLVDGQAYALPAKDVERVDAVGREDLREVDGRYVLRNGDEMVGVVDARALLGAEEAAARRDTWTVLIIRRGGRALAVGVDDVLGEREAMTRPLGEFLKGVRLCRGVALTDAGEAVPLLDAGELLARGAQQEASPSPQAISPLRTTMQTGALPKIYSTLVVEDSEITRTLITGILRGLGHRVLEAGDGQKAWEILQGGRRVDLVVSDVQMPRMSGLSLLEKIRADDRLRDLPVVMLTTLGAAADKERAMGLGADGYLVKLRFDEKELIRMVRRLLE